MHIDNEPIIAKGWIKGMAESIARNLATEVAEGLSKAMSKIITERMAVVLDERMVESLQYSMTEALDKGWSLGRAEGNAKGKAEALLTVARSKFGSVPEDRLETVRFASPNELDGWLHRVHKATSLDEVFDEVDGSASTAH